MSIEIEKGINIFNKLVAFITAATVIGGAIYFYKTNIWRPSITVLSADYDKGVAVLNVNGIQKILYKNTVLSVGGDFGVRFSGNEDTKITRIELYKNWLTYSIIDNKK